LHIAKCFRQSERTSTSDQPFFFCFVFITQLFSIAIFVHESGVEFSQTINEGVKLLLRRQEGRPEVPGPFLLSKARTRNHADAGGIKHGQAIETVRLLASCLGSLNSLLGQPDLREGIHGSLGLVAGHTLHLVEAINKFLGPPLQGLWKGEQKQKEEKTRKVVGKESG